MQICSVFSIRGLVPKVHQALFIGHTTPTNRIPYAQSQDSSNAQIGASDQRCKERRCWTGDDRKAQTTDHARDLTKIAKSLVGWMLKGQLYHDVGSLLPVLFRLFFWRTGEIPFLWKRHTTVVHTWTLRSSSGQCVKPTHAEGRNKRPPRQTLSTRYRHLRGKHLQWAWSSSSSPFLLGKKG